METWIICSCDDTSYFNMSREELIEEFFLFETKEKPPEISVPFIYNDKHYSACCTMPQKKIAVVREFKIEGEIERNCEHEITCPNCGHENSDSYEYSDDGEEECQTCGATYEYHREVSCTYDTTIVKNIDIKELCL